VKIPSAKIELAAAQDGSRYSLEAVKLDVEGKRFLASDGHIAAIVPAEITPEDHSGLIAAETFKTLRAIARKDKVIPPLVNVNSKVTVMSSNGQTAEFPLVNGQFPEVDRVMPKFEGSPTIALDAVLLLRLAQALSDAASNKRAVVELWIKDKRSAIAVRVQGEPNAQGCIMPCRV
jgi:DNA polymerase III sliding clamp (beta) subunit (PCNA family)